MRRKSCVPDLRASRADTSAARSRVPYTHDASRSQIRGAGSAAQPRRDRHRVLDGPQRGSVAKAAGGRFCRGTGGLGYPLSGDPIKHAGSRRLGPGRGRRLHDPISSGARLGLPRAALGTSRPVIALRLWLIATGILVIALAVWAFAPVLLFMALLTAALAAISALMIAIARALQAWRQRR